MEGVNDSFAAVDAGGSESDMGRNHGIDCSACAHYGVFVVVLFWQFVNWIIKSVGPPKSLRDDEWKWRNLTISWLHALACVVWSVGSLLTQPEMLSDLQYYNSTSILFLVTFTTGYFLYDFLDLALNGKMFAMWEVQVHHVAVGGVFYYNIVNCEWLAFNVVAFLVEVNSFFLHQRKLLQMMGTSYNSLLYRVTIFLNITTFVIFRGIPLVAILWAMAHWYHRVSLAYYLVLGASMLVMVVLNPILFLRLLRSDYLRGRSHSGAKPSLAATVVANGNNNHLDSHSHSHSHNHSHLKKS